MLDNPPAEGGAWMRAIKDLRDKSREEERSAHITCGIIVNIGTHACKVKHKLTDTPKKLAKKTPLAE